MADEMASYKSAIICPISKPNFAAINNLDDFFVDAIVTCKEQDQHNGKRMVISCRNGFERSCGFEVEGREVLLNVVLRTFAGDEIQRLTNTREISDQENTDLHSSTMIVACQDFLSRHKLLPGQTIFIKEITPLPLTKLVLSCQSIQDHATLGTDLVEQLSNSLFKNKVVVRSNDILKFSVDSADVVAFQVLQCEPILQGIVDLETTLVLETYPSEDLRNQQQCIEVNKDILDLPSLLLADVALPIKEINKENTDIPDFPNKGCLKLTVNYIDWMSCHLSVLPREKSVIADDINRVYVSMETMMSMNILNGSWVHLWADSSSGSSEKRSDTCQSARYMPSDKKVKKGSHVHTAQIFALNDNLRKNDHNTIFISPLLFFNLLQQPATTDVSDTFTLNVDTVITPTCEQWQDNADRMKNTAPPFAREAHISLITTPNVRHDESFSQQLTHHFTTPKMLTVGDIICVKCDWQQSDASGLEEGQRCRIVYFKVMKLVASSETSTCLVDTEHTSLYQKGVVHSYVPVMMEPLVQFQQGYHDVRGSLHPPGLESTQEEMEAIIKPCLSSRASTLHCMQVLLIGPPGTGKKRVAMATSRRLHLPVLVTSCYDLIGESVAATEARIKNVFAKANACRPCILLLCSIHAVGKDREGQEDEPRIALTIRDCLTSTKDQSDMPLIVIATSSTPDSISHEVYECFLHEVKIKAPSEQERLSIMKGLGSVYQLSPDVQFDLLAKRTAGFVLADIEALFTQASNAASRRIANYIQTKILQDDKPEANKTGGRLSNDLLCLEADVCRSGVTINFQDFQQALDVLQASHSDAIGAPKIPDVSWKDVGGLMDVKAEILDTIQLPLQHPELFAAGLRRSGVLLYGPPGTGKTLLAKAVATECALNFLSVKGPELINMYVGQSEQNVREVFTRAQSASPCVIFFDELDSLAPNRGRSGDSGGVMDRVVSQLLAELDGLHSTCDVFVIGATNRPDLLDPALLRPGRFDKLLYLGVSEDHHAQMNIINALTRKFNFTPDFRLDEVVNECPINLTGADLYALCSDAMLQAMRRIIQQHKDDDQEEEVEIEVSLADFHAALDNLTPSVSVQELERYKQIKGEFTV